MARRTTLLTGYAVLAAADAALAAKGIRRARRLTKPALMPTLMAAVLAGGKRTSEAPADPMMLAGLGLSWAGDVALLGEGEGPFTVGLGSFLVAHLVYLAVLRRRHAGFVRRHWPTAAIYGLSWCVLNAVLWRRTGKLRVPVLVYGTTLTGMALAALDTGCPETAIGGAAFLLSDSILALDTFGVVQLPAADAMVMATYAAAQALIGLSSSKRRAGEVI